MNKEEIVNEIIQTLNFYKKYHENTFIEFNKIISKIDHNYNENLFKYQAEKNFITIMQLAYNSHLKTLNILPIQTLITLNTTLKQFIKKLPFNLNKISVDKFIELLNTEIQIPEYYKLEDETDNIIQLNPNYYPYTNEID
ncbi:hypothetical protein [Methanosphaera cuniculi]|uniref:hypothetical protein n=1 Tax=Methanosphaera cuniculi TaxID=1077256 RepID=UPI0026EA466F|nr:hypothetical protein [Methanosphaera cuniculi]